MLVGTKPVRNADVSVVIPVKNGARTLRACLTSLRSQDEPPGEIIVIDSGSTDNSLEIVRELSDVRLIEIPPAEFNHGETRNLGVRMATRPAVLFTVQDARAASSSWIVELLRPMHDPRVAAVTGSQVVPHDPDNNPIDWNRPRAEGEPVRYSYADAAAFDALPASQKRWASAVDNVCTIYRKDALLAIPFPSTPFGEDVLWGPAALRAGWTLVFNPRARVFHYHHEDASLAYNRAFASVYYRYVATGYRGSPPRALNEMKRAFGILLRQHGMRPAERLYWLRYTWRRHVAVGRALRDFNRMVDRGDDEIQLKGNQASAQASPASLGTPR